MYINGNQSTRIDPRIYLNNLGVRQREHQNSWYGSSFSWLLQVQRRPLAAAYVCLTALTSSEVLTMSRTLARPWHSNEGGDLGTGPGKRMHSASMW